MKYLENIVPSNLKTLIILIGECRGGEETWKTMYENLMIPYNADLALCVGKKNNESIKKNFLTEKSKYIWTINEYEDWYDYFRENFGNSGIWESNLAYGLNGGGGTRGVIPIIFKHFIYQNYSKILEKYDRIILTRTDMYYIHKYPILSNDHFWLMNGEDHGGYCDRFFCFPSKYLKECLNICEYVNSKELSVLLNKMYEQNSNLSYIQNLSPIENGMFNSESYHRLYFEYTGIVYKIRRCPVLQFIVSSSEDTTRTPDWEKNSTNFKNGLIIRYKNEFIDAFRTSKLFKVPTYIE
jgi:hypothetical protein